MDRARPKWAGRVLRWKIALLYATDARGIVDEELIDEVGCTLLARCESILTTTEAHKGRAACPECGTIMTHNWEKEKLLRCGGCGWELTWPEYHRSYRRKHLLAGGMEPFIREFVEKFPKAKSPGEKMVLIDTLIHKYHWELEGDPGRPGAVNLIGGRPPEVVAFLNELTYGEQSTAGLVENAQAWRRKLSKEDAIKAGWLRDVPQD